MSLRRWVGAWLLHPSLKQLGSHSTNCNASHLRNAYNSIRCLATATVEGSSSSGGSSGEQGAGRFTLASMVLFMPSALCGALTYWQLERKAWKDDLIHRRRDALLHEPKDVFTAEELKDYDKVHATGVLLHDRSLFVGPRPRSIPGQRMQSGFLMITPLYNAERKGVVLVNRGWVPSAWKDQLPPQADAKRPVKVVGVIQPNESPSQFVSENIPEDAEFHYINVAALASSLGLPHDTPLIMNVSSDAGALEARKKSPLEESRSAPPPTVTFPIPKHETDLIRFVTMPEDHLIYAGTWASLCLVLGLMARHAIKRPHKLYRLVGGQSAREMYNK